MNKLTALFTTGSGLALVALFVYGGLSAISSHLTGNVGSDVLTVVSLLGMILHPTDMVAGRSVSK